MLENITRDVLDTRPMTSLVNDVRELRHSVDNVTNRMIEIDSKLSSKLSIICTSVKE